MKNLEKITSKVVEGSKLLDPIICRITTLTIAAAVAFPFGMGIYDSLSNKPSRTDPKKDATQLLSELKETREPLVFYQKVAEPIYNTGFSLPDTVVPRQQLILSIDPQSTNTKESDLIERGEQRTSQEIQNRLKASNIEVEHIRVSSQGVYGHIIHEANKTLGENGNHFTANQLANITLANPTPQNIETAKEIISSVYREKYGDSFMIDYDGVGGLTNFMPQKNDVPALVLLRVLHPAKN